MYSSETTIAAMLKVIAAGIFDKNIQAEWVMLSADLKEAVEDYAAKCDYRRLLYYYLGSAAFTVDSRKLKLEFISQAANAAARDNAAAEIETLFNKNGIDYRLIKGITLCRDVYPASALRHSVDVDILVRERDAEKAFKLAIVHGAVPEHEYLENCRQHLPRLTYKKIFFEIHTYLFDGIENENECLWREFERKEDNIELLLLHLLHHSFLRHFFLNGAKTLIDVGYIIKKYSLDMDYFHDLEQKFQCAGLLDIILTAFPEFFMYTNIAPRKGVPVDMRKLLLGIAFEHGVKNIGNRDIEAVYFEHKSWQSKLRHVFARIKFLTPDYFVQKYRISHARAFWFFPGYFLFELWGKTRLYFKTREKMRNSGKKEDVQRINFIMTLQENILKVSRPGKKNGLESIFK